MKKYASIVNNKTKQCNVGLGTDTEFYESIGMKKMDVEQAYDGQWYVKGYAPEKPTPTHEEQSANRERAYSLEVDPITCHINRLKDEQQTPEIEAEIEALKTQREQKVEDIKNRYPYPEE